MNIISVTCTILQNRWPTNSPPVQFSDRPQKCNIEMKSVTKIPMKSIHDYRIHLLMFSFGKHLFGAMKIGFKLPLTSKETNTSNNFSSKL